MDHQVPPHAMIEAMARTVWIAACIRCEGDITAARVYGYAMEFVDQTQALREDAKQALRDAVASAVFWRDLGSSA